MITTIEGLADLIRVGKQGAKPFEHANANAAQYMPMLFAEDYHGRVVIVDNRD
jgi:hypothetical protein